MTMGIHTFASNTEEYQHSALFEDRDMTTGIISWQMSNDNIATAVFMLCRILSIVTGDAVAGDATAVGIDAAVTWC